MMMRLMRMLWRRKRRILMMLMRRRMVMILNMKRQDVALEPLSLPDKAMTIARIE